MQHGHVVLNGKKVNIPSVRLKVGDEISLKQNSFKLPMVVETLQEPALIRPEWLSWNEIPALSKVAHLPAPEDVPFEIDVQQVVEYYANRI